MTDHNPVILESYSPERGALRFHQEPYRDSIYVNVYREASAAGSLVLRMEGPQVSSSMRFPHDVAPLLRGLIDVAVPPVLRDTLEEAVSRGHRALKSGNVNAPEHGALRQLLEALGRTAEPVPEPDSSQPPF
jgi:hypothetical protein